MTLSCVLLEASTPSEHPSGSCDRPGATCQVRAQAAWVLLDWESDADWIMLPG